MSVEENKAIVHRYLEKIVNERNLAVIDELFTTDYVLHGPSSDEVKGLEDLRQRFDTFHTAFPDLHLKVEDMFAEGEKVVVRFTGQGTHKAELQGIAPTGKRITVTGIEINRVVNNKIVEAWEVLDNLGMMQQLGVIPPLE